MVQVHLLGRVAVTTDGGEPVDVGPAKCQAVLAALALSVGEAVPVSRLVRVVWGEDPPRTADKTLQGYVARLRKGLGPDAIARAGAAYRLELDPDAVEDALGRRVATDPAATIAPLTELTADHPFREGLWALLMTALYRAGRQADALAAYQRARHHLVEELGVEPGQRLRELEARILDHDDQDARQALVYMRDVLDELAEDAEAAQRPSRP